MGSCVVGYDSTENSADQMKTAPRLAGNSSGRLRDTERAVTSIYRPIRSNDSVVIKARL